MSRSTSIARRRARRPFAAFSAAAVFAVSAFASVAAAPVAAAAGPAISVAKSAPGSVLVGDTIGYTLTATNPSSNPGAVPDYNVTFRDVLPVGVTYVAGSTTPSALGDPTIITNAGAQTLIWSNVADVQVDSSFALGFSAKPAAATFPVGSVVTNTGYAYASTDPRTVPSFDATGAPVANPNVVSASDGPKSTTISALSLTKDEPSPESELLRGVQTRSTVYTLTVKNNSLNATNAVTLTDYLPAGLEFLNCGGVDYSTSLEYPGAPPLSVVPTVATNCPTPTSVTTVLNPPASGSQTYPPGVYTQVTWSLGNLTPGQTVTVRYAAGIPLKTNTMTWSGTTPTAASGKQGSNLDNNGTGASTRELGTEATLTNRAQALGTYTGPLAGGASAGQEADTTHTVSIEDVSMQKTADTANFSAGGIVTYTIKVNVSQYVNASNIVITDDLGNGLCPLSSTTNYVSGAPSECDPVPGSDPTGATFSSVVQNGNGTFTMTFSALSVAADGTATITYQARMRATYTGGGSPTVAGDSFSNVANLTANTTPVANTGQPGGTLQVTDSSGTTMASSGLSMAKTLMPTAAGSDCTTGPYVKPTDPGYTPSDFVFRYGQKVCFQIRVVFPSNVRTKDPVLTDFLPAGTSYVPGSATTVTAPGSAVTFNEAAAAAGTANPTWLAGDPIGGGNYVPAGQTLVVRLAATVTSPSSSTAVQVKGNLAKLRSVSTAGAATSLRDSVDLGIAPPPPVSILKGVSKVNGLPAAGNPANTDGVSVVEGSVVTFRVDVTNSGTAATSTNVPISGTQVWDVLPTGITCAAIANISNALPGDATTPQGVCTNPGDAGQPTFTGNTTRSAITWTFRSGAPGATEAIAAGATRTLTYDMTIPSPTSVSTTLTNTAAVRSFQAPDGLGGFVTYYPASNVDTSVPAASYNAAAASDNSNVVTPNVTVAKTIVSSSVNEQNNNGTNQLTNGEQITYRIGATVPAHTTIYQATLSDALPAGLTFVSATAAYNPAGTSPAANPLPGSVTLNATNGVLTWPATYTNASATPQLFEVTLTAVASPTVGTGNKQNTATFLSKTAPTGGSNISRTATATASLVQMNPTLAKTNDAAGTVTAGQTVTYTLTAANTAGRPPAHDVVVVDCVPSGLTFGAWGTVNQGSVDAPIAGTGANGCPAGTTLLTWRVGTVNGGASVAQTYTATVDPAAAGLVTYTNNATLTASSLDDGGNNPATERVVTSPASSSVTVVASSLTKTEQFPTRTVGDTQSWTVSLTLPAKVNFYDAAILDTLPAGVDPATLSLDSTTCVFADSSPCTIPWYALTSVPGTGGSTIVGWGAKDVLANLQARSVTLTYSAKVADVAAAVHGASLANSARAVWNTVNGPDPTSAGATWSRTGTPSSVSFLVTEPQLTPTKTVSNPNPAPGDTFGYQVSVTNSNAADASAAYNITVTDTVPTGVVVNPASISDAGTIAGQTPTGGGTISWTLTGPLAKGATKTFTYSATLAASGGLTGASLVNTARITHYESLPSGGRSYTGGSATASVTPAFPTLTTTKTMPGGSLAYLGQPFSWRLKTTASVTKAYAVNVIDTLPAGWTYVAGSAQVSVAGAPAAQIEPGIAPAAAGDVLTWTSVGDLPVGTSVVVDYQARPTAAVLSPPGAGLGSTHLHTNAVYTTGSDATGATGSGSGPYRSNTATASAHIDAADLTITKSHSGSVSAGTSFDWKLHVTNLGTDTAVGPFTVTDTLPTGVTFASYSGTGWSCTGPVSRVLTCTSGSPGSLAPSASLPDLTVTVAVPAGTANGTTFTNNAHVSGSTYDPNPLNNDASDTVTLSNVADLKIVKAASGPFVAGHPVAWTLDVSNLGPSVATSPTVTDVVPAAVSNVTANGSGWSCSVSGQTVTCQLSGDLAAGASAGQIVVSGDLSPSATGTLTNAADVSSVTTDPVPGNNHSSVTVPLGTLANLSVSKSHTGPLVPGQDVTYHVTVTNAGPSDAVNVTVTDTMPALVTPVAPSVPGWSCTVAGQVVTCSLATSLAPGASVSLDLVGHVASNASGTLTNHVHVATTTPESDYSDNDASDPATSNPKVDLGVTKTHPAAPPVVAGQDVTFTLTVTNHGPSDTTGDVTLVDALPAGMTLGSATGSGWTCTDDGLVPTKVTCVTSAVVTSGAAAPPVTIVAHVAPSAGPATLVNTADVSGVDPDPDLTNNHAADPVDVHDVGNVSISKTVSGANPVAAGATTQFTLTVSSDGPSDADAVVVSDTLPAGMTLQNVSAPGWSCTSDATSFSCTRPTLAAGTSAALVVDVSVRASLPDGTTLSNTAHVSTSTNGDDPLDNDSTASVSVVTRADLSITKSHAQSSVAAGQAVDWTIVVTNHGPSDAQGPITVVDQLPQHLSITSWNGPWTCVVSGPASDVVTCTWDTPPLASGDSADDLVLHTLVAPDAPDGPLTNHASVSSPTTDPNPGNNQTDDTVQTHPVADVSVTKTHTGHGRVGDTVTFSLTVHNAGPSSAADVLLVDTLPTGLTYVSSSPAGSTAGSGTFTSCSLANGTTDTLQCPLTGLLLPSGSAQVDVTVTVTAAAFPGVTNRAEVSTSTDDSDPSNNTASDPLVVDPLADLAIVKTHVGSGWSVGQDRSFVLTVTNAGPTPDPGPITVTDPLPVGVAFVSSTASGAGGTWTCQATSGDPGATVTCRSSAGLGVGASARIGLVVHLSAAAAPGVSNTASVSGTADDPNPGDNTSTDTVPVRASVDLRLTKTGTVGTDGSVTWTLRVSNGGPNAAPGPLVLTDRLAPTLVFQSAETPGVPASSAWACGTVGQLVTCQWSHDLAVGRSAPTLLIHTTFAAGVPSGTTVKNTAVVTDSGGDTTEANPADNSASATVTVPTNASVLPQTGAGSWWRTLLAALVLVGVGAVLVTVGRRRA